MQVMRKVTQLVKYKTFKEYLTSEGLGNTLPGTDSVVDGIRVYRKYYTREQEKEYGIVAVHLS